MQTLEDKVVNELKLRQTNFFSLQEVRDLIKEAIEDLAVELDLYTCMHYLVTEENVPYYNIALNGSDFLYCLNAEVVEYNRILHSDTISSLYRRNNRWADSQGTPEVYCSIGVDNILFYPIPGEKLTIKMEVVCIPTSYDTLSIMRELEVAVVSYVKYNKYIKQGRIEKAFSAYEDYIVNSGLTNQIRGHRSLMREMKYGSDK